MKASRRLSPLAAIAVSLATACGGASQSESTAPSGEGERSAGADEFQLSTSDTAGQAHGERPSEITATATEAAMRLFVVDPDAGPLSGVVIKMTGADGRSYYTQETDSVGYAEVLVPAGQRYELEYLSLGRRTARAQVEVPAGPNQDIRLTLRHRRWRPPARPTPAPTEAQAAAPEPPPPGLVLEGILFQSGSATLDPGSTPRLDRVVEYMTHVASARIRITGHTDNVGDPERNRALSQARADAVRDYLVSHGIDAGRVEAVGYGDQLPVASNDTEEGREQNRRIEAVEL